MIFQAEETDEEELTRTNIVEDEARGLDPEWIALGPTSEESSSTKRTR